MRHLLTTAAVLALASSAVAQEPARPSADAVRLPDGVIRIDARGDEWEAFVIEPLVSDAKTGWGAQYPERGDRTGDDDCSFSLKLAHDSKHLYVLAHVHDEFLVNTSDAKDPYYGDDFELFIDANPKDKRFAAARNENCLQFVFVPARVNPNWPEVFVWQTEKFPGLKAASRLVPGGYVIEVAVPKALFPHWKENANLDAIGFDAIVEEADSPGVDAAHPSIEGVMWMMRQGNHFMTSEGLGEVRLGQEIADAQAVQAEEEVASPEQKLLDALGTPEAADRLAELLVASPQSTRVAFFALWADEKLVYPKELSNLLSESALDLESKKYALMANARRGLLRGVEWYDDAMSRQDRSMTLTALWCAGLSGEKSLTPRLVKVLKHDNLRFRMMAAWALGQIGDDSALPALEEMAESDRHGYGQRQAQLAIEQIRASR